MGVMDTSVQHQTVETHQTAGKGAVLAYVRDRRGDVVERARQASRREAAQENVR